MALKFVVATGDDSKFEKKNGFIEFSFVLFNFNNEQFVFKNIEFEKLYVIIAFDDNDDQKIMNIPFDMFQ